MALAALVLALNPMIEQLLAVEQFGVDRRSWVVIQLDTGLSSAEVERIEVGLLGLPSVDGMTDTTERELGLIQENDAPVPDLEYWRTLGVDGELAATTVSQLARNVAGVAAAYPRIAKPPDSHLDFFERAAPVATAIMLAVALILVVRLVVVRALAVASGSVLMRWLRLVVGIAIPVVVTILGATLVTAAVWPSLVYPVISQSASDLISGRTVARPGIELAVYAGVVVLILTLLAVSTVEHHEPKHRA